MKISTVHQCMNNLYDTYNQIQDVLNARNIIYETGNYNGHFVCINGIFEKQLYYIPVLSLNKFCDIGVNLDGIFCEIQIEKNKLSLETLKKILEKYKDVDIYGFDNCLDDFYLADDTVQDVFEKINSSTETKIKINKLFSYDDFIDAVDFTIDVIAIV